MTDKLLKDGAPFPYFCPFNLAETHLPIMVTDASKEEVQNLEGAQTLSGLLHHNLHKSFSKFRKDSAKVIHS